MIAPATAPATGEAAATRPAALVKATSELGLLSDPPMVWNRFPHMYVVVVCIWIIELIQSPGKIQQEHRYTIDSVKTVQKLSRSETLEVY